MKKTAMTDQEKARALLAEVETRRASLPPAIEADTHRPGWEKRHPRLAKEFLGYVDRLRILLKLPAPEERLEER